MDKKELVVIAFTQQLSYSKCGSARWSALCELSDGRPMCVRTRPGVAAVYACNLNAQQGEVLHLTYHETRTGNLIATDWERPAPGDGAAQAMRDKVTLRRRREAALASHLSEWSLNRWVMDHLTAEEFAEVVADPYGWPRSLNADHLLADRNVLRFVHQRFHADVMDRLQAAFVDADAFLAECDGRGADLGGGRFNDVATLVALSQPKGMPAAAILAQLERQQLLGVSAGEAASQRARSL